MKIYLNGEIVDEKEAKISVFDRSYLFGEGLFETLRSYNGTLPFLDRHLKRMEWSTAFLGLPYPDPATIKKGVLDLLEINRLKDARIKIILSGTNQGMRPQLPTDQMTMNLVILAESFVPWPVKDYKTGVMLCVIHSVNNDPSPVSNMKTTNTLPKIMARREFMERDCFDGILLNADGFVTETSSANIFWVKNEMIFTPHVNAGLLNGITRDVLFEIFKNEKIPFKETFAKTEELQQADEIFITGSTLEVMPVTQLGDKKISHGKPGPLTNRTQELYRQYLEKEKNMS